jgi:hypothetical protein
MSDYKLSAPNDGIMAAPVAIRASHKFCNAPKGAATLATASLSSLSGVGLPARAAVDKIVRNRWMG